MQKHSKDQEAIVTLLTRIYFDIVVIEEEFKLFAGAGDMRPRIDYFHDAVRAFTADGEGNKRLSVELLAYDLRCLQYIQEMPSSPFREGGENLSPTQTIITTEADLMTTGNKPDRKTRTRISELYQHYAVMFAALLKPAADHDYHDRIDTLNNDVQDINAIIEQFNKKSAVNLNTVSQLTQRLEEAELKFILLTFMQHKKHESAADITKLSGHLKNQIKQKDANIKAIEEAHLRFATTQLSIFEKSSDLLKKLAREGTNLAGKFVETSIADTKRQMGR